MIRMRVYEARSKKGWSTRKLSDMSGISKTHINNIENGVSSPTLSCLYRLAKALDVKMEELYEVDYDDYYDEW